MLQGNNYQFYCFILIYPLETHFIPVVYSLHATTLTYLFCKLFFEGIMCHLEKEFPLSVRDSNYHPGNCFQQLRDAKNTHYSEIINGR